MPRSLSILVFALAATLLVAGLVVPTGAQTIDEPAEGLELEADDGPNGEYATVSDDELELRFERLNDRGRSTFDGVLLVTANESGRLWIEHDVEGVTFYVDDSGREITASEPLEFEPNETVAVGVSVDTHAAESGTREFTIRAESDPGEPDNRELPSPTTAALGGPATICLLFLLSAANRRRKL